MTSYKVILECKQDNKSPVISPVISPSNINKEQYNRIQEIVHEGRCKGGREGGMSVRKIHLSFR